MEKRLKKQSGTETSSFGTSERINHNSDSKLYSEVEKKEEVSKVENPLPKEFENRFILGSAESMYQLPDSCVHLVITSPLTTLLKSMMKTCLCLNICKCLQMFFKKLTGY
ncbi:MAG: hypothetical protein NZ521_08080 [Flammeovirgaceae bacterium]|nr:hypothetical protein [Flammeovirgaceae bacterium]MDW8288168.1 hypothetical protein [Flammeovirgaceae bacterium]